MQQVPGLVEWLQVQSTLVHQQDPFILKVITICYATIIVFT